MKELCKISTILIFLAVILLSFASCSLKTPLNINVNVEQNSISYVENEDFQYFYGSYYNSIPKFAKVDMGYYFVTDFKLFYFDTVTKQAYPVCNKANCDHNDSDCNAYLSISNFGLVSSIAYYDNNIYILGFERDSALRQHNYIYQISLEDYKQRKAAYLFDSGSSLSVTYLIHRGYVYFTYDGGEMKETTATLYRVKLGDTNKKAPEKIYEVSGIGVYITGFNAYGNNVFFKTASYKDEQGNGYKNVANCIDIHTLDSKMITETEYSCFAENGKVYYEPDEKTVMKIDVETGEETLFCNIEGPCYISADSDYIYLDNRQSMYIDENVAERRISVYDKNGNYLTEIIPKNLYDECFFGGDDLMIFRDYDANVYSGTKGYYVLDKSTLPDSYEFTYIESR